MMHGRGKSDSAIVAVKPTNKVVRPAAEQSAVEQTAAEPVEPRAETKGNADWQSTRRTQSRAGVSQALERMRQALPLGPEVGAVCGKAASTDLCGGRSVMGVPTATGASSSRSSAARRAWPFAARAQQGERCGASACSPGAAQAMRIGRPETRHSRKRSQNLGWTDGRNVQIDYRTASGGLDALRRYAAEIVALAPDVILTSGSVSMAPLLRATRTIPIVFTNVPDPVGASFVKSLSKPGGNVTGFMQAEYDLSGKWLELLKQIVPSVTRAAVLRDPEDTAGIGQFAVIQSVARSVGVEVSPINVRDTGELESIVADFARSPNGGLVVTASAPATIHRKLIISTAARHKLPAIYPRRLHVADGGLMSYGSDVVDMNRRAASYVDRILKGEKPVDLPVQAPTRYELVINLKTAKALGLDVPATLLARADEVIE